MRIDCLNGYFTFIESRPGEMGRLKAAIKLDVSPISEAFGSKIFTFTGTKEIPTHTIKGSDFMGNEALATCEGKPWYLFEKNEVVFDFARNQVRPIEEIKTNVSLVQSGYYWVSSGLILPGSLTVKGRVLSYSAWLAWDTITFKYSWVRYG